MTTYPLLAACVAGLAFISGLCGGRRQLGAQYSCQLKCPVCSSQGRASSHTPRSGPSLELVRHATLLFGGSVCLLVFMMLVAVLVSKPLEPPGKEGDFPPILGRWLLLL